MTGTFHDERDDSDTQDSRLSSLVADPLASNMFAQQPNSHTSQQNGSVEVAQRAVPIATVGHAQKRSASECVQVVQTSSKTSQASKISASQNTYTFTKTSQDAPTLPSKEQNQPTTFQKCIPKVSLSATNSARLRTLMDEIDANQFAYSRASIDVIIEALDELLLGAVTKELLPEYIPTINALRYHSDPTIKEKATSLITQWRLLITDLPGNTSPHGKPVSQESTLAFHCHSTEKDSVQKIGNLAPSSGLPPGLVGELPAITPNTFVPKLSFSFLGGKPSIFEATQHDTLSSRTQPNGMFLNKTRPSDSTSSVMQPSNTPFGVALHEPALRKARQPDTNFTAQPLGKLPFKFSGGTGSSSKESKTIPQSPASVSANLPDLAGSIVSSISAHVPTARALGTFSPTLKRPAEQSLTAEIPPEDTLSTKRHTGPYLSTASKEAIRVPSLAPPPANNNLQTESSSEVETTTPSFEPVVAQLGSQSGTSLLADQHPESSNPCLPAFRLGSPGKTSAPIGFAKLQPQNPTLTVLSPSNVTPIPTILSFEWYISWVEEYLGSSITMSDPFKTSLGALYASVSSFSGRLIRLARDLSDLKTAMSLREAAIKQLENDISKSAGGSRILVPAWDERFSKRQTLQANVLQIATELESKGNAFNRLTAELLQKLPIPLQDLVNSEIDPKVGMEKYTKMQTSLRHAGTSLKNEKEKVASLEKVIEQKDIAFNARSDMLTIVKEEVNKIRNEQAQDKSIINHLTTTLETANSDAATQKKDFENELRRIGGRYSHDVQKRVDQARLELAEQIKKTETTEHQYKVAMSELEVSRKNSELLNKERDHLESTVSDWKGMHKVLQNEVKVYKQGYDQFRKSNVALEEGKTQLQAEFETLKQEYDDLSKTVHSAQPISRTTAPSVPIAGQVRSVTLVANNGYTTDLKSLDGPIKHWEHKLELAHDPVTRKEAAVTELDKEIANITHQLQELKRPKPRQAMLSKSPHAHTANDDELGSVRTDDNAKNDHRDLRNHLEVSDSQQVAAQDPPSSTKAIKVRAASATPTRVSSLRIAASKVSVDKSNLQSSPWKRKD
ncbi:hypothetical protein P153DRAFT_388551 [Dothidotthia symphoricarpi CBS 119687]|uniref:TFIIS N-terminal domain-containing protein n=1 Tax=Dothidotthia symphoricarpi CBS 119687 TaxID=1392245 RepID=A0A6A6A3X0_9PLEO|nr:uncharacterized protein P153DRAFT_388551 [Dothidotthia symphoricarpi CBS 119687]KAF2126510.1 hypothetical protein P153DRAFT_388551 [Dothidotthia symphoricarpi CBS 119687]